jgi:hypothetical protein
MEATMAEVRQEKVWWFKIAVQGGHAIEDPFSTGR